MDRRSFTFGITMSVVAIALGDPVEALAQSVLTPEQFGARGDGRSDDSAAFARLGDAISRAGGGRVVLRPTTYLVGGDGQPVRGRLHTTKLLEIVGCSRGVVLEGNGAKLLCPAGQRFGLFPLDAGGSAGGDIHTPYEHMILVERCTGPVHISDLELHGNAEQHVIGRQSGNHGWQIPCSGLRLRDNRGAEVIRNVHTHDHGQDGVYVDGVDAATPGIARVLDGIRSDRNARQGLSLVGGRGYRISNSSFTRTGRGKIASAPHAGIDIEAERGKRIRDIAFSNCRVADNYGNGLVAASGDSSDVTFDGCTFVGTTHWSAWPAKPRFTFNGCTFVGTLIHVFSSAEPSEATRFVGCTFSDDPALSPTGQVFLYGGVCAFLRNVPNVLFDHCSFRLQHGGRLPTTVGAIYADCTMEQRDPRASTPRGVYRGVTRITGAVQLSPSTVEGRLLVNGRSMSGRL